jgi:hypothetical protein
MTDPTAPETLRNEAAERLRRLIDHGEGWPDEYHDLLDAALAEERRLVVKRIRERLNRKVIRRGTDDDGGFWNAPEVRRILDEVEADR